MVKLTVQGVSDESTPHLRDDSLTDYGRDDVACIVVNWSTPDDLKRCIDSAFDIEGPMYWSIWENHHDEKQMRDRNQKAVTDLVSGRSRWIVIQRGKENYGHGYGSNRAAELAVRFFDPEYLFLVNPDAKWVEPILDKMIDFLDAHPKAAMVGPKQMDSRYRITAGGIKGDNVGAKHRFWLQHDQANEVARDTFMAPTIAGSAILVRAKVFMELGGLLEAKHYYSETWLCYHARTHGYEVWYHGEAWMIHEWHQSSKHGSSQTDGKMQEDRALFRKMCDEHDPQIPHD